MRVFVGSATQREVRLLVLAQSKPDVSVDASGATVSVRRPPLDTLVAGLLADTQTLLHHVRLRRLPAGRTHTVTVEADGVSKKVKVATLPDTLPDDGLTFFVASCHYLGYRDQWNREQALLRALETRTVGGKGASFGVLAGDNVYADVLSPIHGALSMVDRVLGYFEDDDYEAYRQFAPVFSTFDDHELWNNYPSPQAHVQGTVGPRVRRITREACLSSLDVFQAGLNPTPLRSGSRSYRFAIGELGVFVGDVRTQRRRGDDKRMMSAADLDALESFLADWDGPTMIVLGQPLWIRARHKSGPIVADYNPPHYRDEYRRIWRALLGAKWDPLVVSGDIHFSRMLVVERAADQHRVVELASSPVVHIPSEIDATRALARPPKQAKTKNDDPKSIGGVPGAELVHGCDEPNVFSLVHLRREAAGLAVTNEFIDVESGEPVASSKMRIRSAVGPASAGRDARARVLLRPRA